MADDLKLVGLKECREGLAVFSRTIQRNVGKRALSSAAEPIASTVRARAPVSASPYDRTPGSLRASVKVVPSKNKGGPRVSVLAADPASAPIEFGTTKMPAQPFFRSAADATTGSALAAFGAALKVEVTKAAAKAAKKSKAVAG